MTVLPRVAVRTRAARFWRVLWPVVVAAGGAITCDAPTNPGRQIAFVNVAPVFAREAQGSFAGLSADQVRITVVRPPNQQIAQVTIPFSPDSQSVTARVPVEVTGSESLQVTIELLAGPTIVFTGAQVVEAVQGVSNPTTPPTPVVIVYVGPGAGLTAITIQPRDSGTIFGASVPFRVSAVDAQNAPVPQFYTSWDVNSTVHSINANGVFRAGNARGTVWVHANTPTGVKDSTRITISPVATQQAILSGNNQSGPINTALPQQLAVRVLAADNLPVAGVPITFTPASGGGSVLPVMIATDSLGIARTTATLGPASGPNTFTASSPGLSSVTFTATATTVGPAVIVLTLPDTLVGVGLSPPVQVRLLRPAPPGGLTVTVTSDSLAYLTIAAPGTIAFPAGDSIRTINATGVALGLAVVRATAPGYTPDTLFVPVIPPFLTLGAANVSVGASVNVPLTALPRPTSALTVSLTSSDTLVARVPATVNIPANQGTVNVSVQGIAAGTAAILVTAPGYLQGGNVATVGTGGVPSTLSKTAGDNLTALINDTTAVRPQVRVLDAGGAPVAGVQVLFTVASGGGTIAGTTAAVATTNATGFASPAGQWRMGGTAVANTLSASLVAFPGVTAVTFTATAQLPPPQIVLSIFGSNVVGQARTGTLNVRLLQAAPAGGLTVTLTSTRTGLLRIGSYASENGSAAFLQGDTLKTVPVFGDSLVTGIDTVIGTAPGYTPDTLAVPVSINLISLPATLNVALSQTASLPINLSVAAPAGGLKVAVASSNPAAVQVVTDTVTVPAGSQVANATVLGAGIGTATLTATNPNYAPDVSAATTTASLNITQTTITPNASFGLPITIQLESGGLPVSAPAGGVPVTMISRDSACVMAPGTTIPAGQVTAAVLVTYGGTRPLPCSARLVATGPGAGFGTDSVLVNMQPAPVLTINNSYLGAGLQRAVSGSLGASNHGGTTVRVTSTNPALFVISATDSTVGGAFADINIPFNGTSFSYYVQALEGTTYDSANVIATAPSFLPDTAKLVITQPVFDIIFLVGSGNTRSANDPFQVRTGSASTPTAGLSVEDAIRAGGVAMTATIINDSLATANLVSTAATGDTVTVQVLPRQTRSPGTVATGGVELDYTAAGVTNVRATAPGYRSVGAALGQSVTITAPVINVNATYIGSRLQRAASGSLSAVAVAGDTVTLKVSRTGVLRISPNDSTGFADSIQIGIPAGQSSWTYYIQGVDTVTADSVFVSAAVPGFVPDSARIAVFAPVFDVIFLNTSGNTRTANDPFQTRIGSASSLTAGISVEDVLRFGHAPVVFSVINDSAAVGQLITTALTSDSVTVSIVARQARSPTTVATGGVELDYTAGGVTTVRAHTAGFRAVGAALGQNVTVTAPVINLSGSYIGARLQRQTSGSLTAVGIAGDTVTLKTTRPGVIRISPNDSTGFADSIQVAVPLGGSSFSYWFQGVDTVTADSVDVIATLPAFVSDTARFAVYRPVYDIIFLNTTANALANSDPFQVRIGSANNNTAGISVEDVLRFGHAPITATLNTSAATVAQLNTQTTQGSTATVQIVARAARSPSAVGTTPAPSGVELDYLTTGTTVVTADLPNFRTLPSDTVTVTVTAPFATASSATVAAGLQENASVSLSSGNHNGIDVVVKSSNPAIMRVSPNATTPGTDSIIVHVNPSGTSFSYYVQGVERPLTGSAVQVTVRATAPGFTDGTGTITVVDPAIDVIFLAASGNATTPTPTADDPFQVRIGYANAPSNTGMSVEQTLRAGFTGDSLTVTIQLTDSAAARLKTLGAPAGAGTVTVVIPARMARSGGSLSFDFVAQGITRVVPTATNFVTVKQASPLDGYQVVVNP